MPRLLREVARFGKKASGCASASFLEISDDSRAASSAPSRSPKSDSMLPKLFRAAARVSGLSEYSTIDLAIQALV